MSESPQYDPRYLEGIRLFNECEFYECHDVWEELWADYQGPSRKFYQGLIQTAVCLFHLGNENFRGSRKLYLSSRAYLEPYRPQHLELDLDKLFTELEAFCGHLFVEEAVPKHVELDWDLVPEIHLQGVAD